MNKKRINNLEYILLEIKKDASVTQKFLSDKYNYSERQVRRHFKLLKDMNVIRLKRNGATHIWELVNK